MEVLKSELNIFNELPTQLSVENGQWVWHKPISSIGSSSVIEFAVPGSGEYYTDLAMTMLYCKVKIVKTDGTALPTGANVALVNNSLHSLFKQCEVKLNDTTVSPSAANYPYRAYIETLLNFGNDAKNSHLGTAGWYKDTSSQFDELTNAGFVKRKALATESKEIELYGNIFCDIFNFNKYLINGVQLKISLTRNSNNFALFSDTDDAYKIEFLDAALVVRKMKIMPKIILAHQHGLLRSNAKYPFTRTEIKTKTLPVAIQNDSFDNIFLGDMPKRVIIGLVSNSAYKGAVKKNPYNFKNQNLNYLTLFVDNEQIPSKALTPNYTTQQFTLAYHTLFSGTGVHFKDDGNDISLSDYYQGYALYAFDLTPDGSASDNTFQNPVKRGQLRLDLGFSDPLQESVVVLVYAEFQSCLQIDRNRTIIRDF